MIRRFYQAHQKTWERFDQFLLGNPILERGLILSAVVVTCTTLANALSLSLAFSLITFSTVTVTFFIPKKLPYTIRVILNALIASVFYIPTVALLHRCFPEAVFNLGVYLPLLTTNSLIVQKSESRYHWEKFPVMLAQLLTAALGFSAAAILIGSIREILGRGSLYGKALEGFSFTAPAVLLPCCGFILVGFLAAGLQKLHLWMEKPPRRRKEGKRHE